MKFHSFTDTSTPTQPIVLNVMLSEHQQCVFWLCLEPLRHWHETIMSVDEQELKAKPSTLRWKCGKRDSSGAFDSYMDDQETFNSFKVAHLLKGFYLKAFILMCSPASLHLMWICVFLISFKSLCYACLLIVWAIAMATFSMWKEETGMWKRKSRSLVWLQASHLSEDIKSLSPLGGKAENPRRGWDYSTLHFNDGFLFPCVVTWLYGHYQSVNRHSSFQFRSTRGSRVFEVWLEGFSLPHSLFYWFTCFSILTHYSWTPLPPAPFPLRVVFGCTLPLRLFRSFQWKQKERWTQAKQHFSKWQILTQLLLQHSVILQRSNQRSAGAHTR